MAGVVVGLANAIEELLVVMDEGSDAAMRFRPVPVELSLQVRVTLGG